MITLILCLRPIRVPKFIWFKILYKRRFEFGREMCQKDDVENIIKKSLIVENYALTKAVIRESPSLQYWASQFCACGILKMVKYTFRNKIVVYWDLALVRACMSGHLRVVKYLAPHCSLKTALYFACHNGHLHIAKYLLKRTCEGINECLLTAIHGGYIEVVELLLHHGASALATALQIAVRCNENEIMALLIKYGANFDFEKN